MDYSLAALKLFCCQLNDARPIASATYAATTASAASMTLYGIRFQRAWLQGVLISGSEEGRFLLDDGSGVVELFLAAESQQQEWKSGKYVMVVGPYLLHRSADGVPGIKVHKIVDLSTQPDRETLWHLEVIEALKLFYLPSLE